VRYVGSAFEEHAITGGDTEARHYIRAGQTVAIYKEIDSGGSGGGSGQTYSFDPTSSDYDGNSDIALTPIGGDFTFATFHTAVGMNQTGGGIVTGHDWQDYIGPEDVDIAFTSNTIETVTLQIRSLAAGEEVIATVKDASGTVLGDVSIPGQGGSSSLFTATIGQSDLTTPGAIKTVYLDRASGNYGTNYLLDEITATESSGGGGSTPTAETRYLLRDHLGSLTVITDELGAVTERLSYDPHGKRRAVDWQASLTPIVSAETRRGFTAHEHLEEVGLVHMNGRVYDPTLGRFLSADPFVQLAGATQAYNRYSYVNNNPLSYTDPSGFFARSVRTNRGIQSVRSRLREQARAPCCRTNALW